MQGKQAKIVSPTQERAILGYLATTRYPARDRVIFLLSMKAGLRAKEMASLTWAMVTDAQGQVADVMHVPNRASKGQDGRPHHSAAPRPPGRAGDVADRARGYGHPRAADPLLRARGWVVAGHRALVVPSAVYLAERWTAVRRIPGAAPLLPARRAASRRLGGVSGMCRNSRAIPVSP